MIQYLLLQNRQGKTRLSKYYSSYTDEEKNKLEGEIHRLVTTRDPKFTNFVEVHAQPSAPPRRAPVTPARPPAPPQYRQHKLIYRRYAGLFFTLCVDVNDNELLYFESIHLFVELLDQFFGNVCELDLVFNVNKARPPHTRSALPLAPRPSLCVCACEATCVRMHSPLCSHPLTLPRRQLCTRARLVATSR